MEFKNLLGAVLACSLTVTSVAAVAHGGASGVVKERMETMKEMKTSMKSLSAMFSGKAAYDPDEVREAALVLQRNSGDALTRLFPEGSLHKPTEAKEIIWQEWRRFGQMADDLQLFSQALGKAADRHGQAGSQGGMGSGHMMGSDSMMGAGHMMGSDSMMGSGHMMGGGMMAGTRPSEEHLAQMPAEMLFKMVTDSCSSCHTRYRQEDE
ncbi:c-type cytochrome [Marinobacterium arenosum]|uniref:c-type cytochrome n=1 Tax=Marinobacterium arenosum TaxID=2862496 RepID=UPI001C948FC6|nr:cytochrome c [Marinobacterium arenosum]